jgi:hypothetical protein
LKVRINSIRGPNSAKKQCPSPSHSSYSATYAHHQNIGTCHFTFKSSFPIKWGFSNLLYLPPVIFDDSFQGSTFSQTSF